MKVFIVGVAGGTGLRLARLLKERGDEVGGLYRRPTQAEILCTSGVTATLGDIVQISERELPVYVRDSDLIVFSAGAGGGDNDAMTDKIDGDGATTSIAAARRARVERFHLVSLFPEAGRSHHFDAGFKHYFDVKKRADVELVRSDLSALAPVRDLAVVGRPR